MKYHSALILVPFIWPLAAHGQTPQNFPSGVSLGSGPDSYLKSSNNGVGQIYTEFSSYNGGLILYSDLEETSPGLLDGGIALWGSPLAFVLGSGAQSGNAGTLDVWRQAEYGGTSAEPVFRIDAEANTARFDSLDVSVSGGSLNVAGSPVLTASSAPSTLVGQGFVQLSGGILNLSSTAPSTSSQSGALTVAGGVGIGGDSFINGIRFGRGSGNVASNIAAGTNALQSNTTGSHNVAFGLDALAANAGGNYNTAVGAKALGANVSGFRNTALGDHALHSSLTGLYNTAVGSEALRNNTANNNNAFGSSALLGNTTGTFNCAFGDNALGTNKLGNQNVAIGPGALYYNGNTTGITDASGNIAIGIQSFVHKTVGSNNVAIGAQSAMLKSGGGNLSEARNSIYIGANSKGGGIDDNAIVIGANAIGEGSDTTVIGNASTTSARIYGETKLEALRVAGDVIIEQPLGDISMGIYGTP